MTTLVEHKPATRDVVVVGASAGGVEAISFLMQHLPEDFPAALAISLHTLPNHASTLSRALGRRAKMRCLEPQDGQPFLPGAAYIAPQDHHLVIRGAALRVQRGPKVHRSRPAIDPLFISAGKEFGSRAIGILLTGNLNDGVAGLVAIKEHGGLCLTQDPAEAPFPSMPRHALRFDHIDLKFRMSDLPMILQALVMGQTLESIRTTAGA